MKRIYFILSVLFAMQMYAQQSTFLYFEDKNGLRDSLEIVVGLTDEQIEQLPSYTPAEAVQAFHDSTCWVVIGDRSLWEDRKYLRTYAFKPYNGMVEGERREIYFSADRIPVTISWDKQFFVDPELTHSVMSDMGSWFDASCSITEMYKVFLTANESWQLSATFEYDDGCSFDYLGGWGELLVRHFGIALGAANNPIESIEEIPTETQCTKLLRDGQIFILRGDKVYTVTGQRIE